MKKMIMLAAVITVGFSITAGLSYAAHAEAKQAAALAYYNNAVYKEAVAGEEYAIQIADNSDAADAEAVIARSNLADAAVETVMLDEESEAAVKVKEMASVCDDDIEAAVAKYKKEHTPAATSTEVPQHHLSSPSQQNVRLVPACTDGYAFPRLA